MKTKLLTTLFILAFIAFAISCKKKIDPKLKNDIIVSSYCGKFTGLYPLDIRTIINVENGASSTEKNFLIDTTFFNSCSKVKILTTLLPIEIANNGNAFDFADEVYINIIDTSGVLHTDLPVAITGNYTAESLSMKIEFILNGISYDIQFNGDNGDYAALIDGTYYGTFSLYGSDFPNDSIKLDWRKKKTVSVIAQTTLEATILDTDVEATVIKENGFCRIEGETIMDFKIDFLEFKDVPAVIQGKITGSHYHLEVTLTPTGYQISIVLTFKGNRS